MKITFITGFSLFAEPVSSDVEEASVKSSIKKKKKKTDDKV